MLRWLNIADLIYYVLYYIKKLMNKMFASDFWMFMYYLLFVQMYNLSASVISNVFLHFVGYQHDRTFSFDCVPLN